MYEPFVSVLGLAIVVAIGLVLRLLWEVYTRVSYDPSAILLATLIFLDGLAGVYFLAGFTRWAWQHPLF